MWEYFFLFGYGQKLFGKGHTELNTCWIHQEKTLACYLLLIYVYLIFWNKRG